MPIGTVHGRGALLARVRAGMALFDRTVHLGTHPVIESDGDRIVWTRGTPPRLPADLGAQVPGA